MIKTERGQTTASQFPICSDHSGINLRPKFLKGRSADAARAPFFLAPHAANSIYMCATDRSSSAQSIIHESEILLPHGENWRV